jgi:hypothetical protein
MKTCIQHERAQGSMPTWMQRRTGILIGMLHLLLSVNSQASQLSFLDKHASGSQGSTLSYGTMWQQMRNTVNIASLNSGDDSRHNGLVSRVAELAPESLTNHQNYELSGCEIGYYGPKIMDKHSGYLDAAYRGEHPSQERPKAEAVLLSEAFIKGFRYELANRAFALQVMQRLAQSSKGYEHYPLWSAYLVLEQFNEPRYQMAAESWRLDYSPGWWVAFKAWAVVSLVPQAFHSTMLTFIHAETVAYVDELKVLQGEGPHEAQPFLSYMVAQEELQLEMMELAMSGRYSEIETLVTEFIARSAVVPPPMSSLRLYTQP